MKTNRHIDWISVTIPNGVNWRNFIPFSDLKLDGKGRHGYGQSWIDRRSGARIETASTRDDMGTHLTLSGEVLNVMRQDLGAVDDAIVKRIEEFDGKCSRIDLAIDMFDSSCTPRMLNHALENREARISARTWRFIDGHKAGINGATIDTGSPASDKRFRFYDKRAEQGIKDGEAWVRLELQLRRLYARATVGACVEHGVSATIGSAVGSYLTWSHEDYQTAIATGEDCTMNIPRKVSNRQKWLLGQVAKALADELLIDRYFRETFNQAVNYFIEQAGGLDAPNK